MTSRFIRALLIGICLFAVVLTLQGYVPTVSSGTWAPTGSMTAARTGASASLLPDGRILIAGGTGTDGSALSTAELFNADGSFSAAVPMNIARTGHAAIMLADGRVLVSGGRTSGGGITNSAETYDPLTNTWQTLSSTMVDARVGHTASQLLDGGVLFSGGENSSGPLASLEIFDLTTDTFHFAGSLSSPRTHHCAAVLHDGRVLIVGGTATASGGSSTVLASTEIYDPNTGAVTAGPSLATARARHSATTLLDGEVLIAGGNDGTNDLASSEIFDPAAGSFSAGPAMSSTRSGQLAFLLPNNNSVLMVGGSSAENALATAELHIPWTGASQPTASMSAARDDASGTPTGQDGLLFVAGGNNTGNPALASGELYGFATVKTDKGDYGPGDVVTITGGGWQPGETVILTLVESPNVDTHAPLTAVADASGNIFNNQFSPDQHDLNVRFYLTAVGSQAQAQNTFTDAVSLGSVQVIGAQTPNPLIPGNTAQYGASATGSVQVKFNGNGAACSANLTATTTPPLPAGATAVLNPSTVTTPDGSDQFSLLQINTTAATPFGTYTFTVQAEPSGCKGATQTTTANLVLVGPASKLVFGVQPSNVQVGAAISPALQVNVMDANGVIRPDSTAPVTVTFDSNPSSATLGGTLTVNAVNGVAIFSDLSVNKLVSSYKLDATSPGLTSATSATFNVVAADTTTQLASSANPSNFGQSATFTATVTNSNNSAAVDEGCVTLVDNSRGGATLGGPTALDGSGHAAFNVSTLSVGAHNLQANYNDSGAGCSNPGTNFNNSHNSPNLAETVNKDNTSTAVVSSKNPSVEDESVTFTATVSNTSAGTTATPTGSVQFQDGGSNLGAPVALVAGSASYTTSSLIVGTHTITAIYTNSDGNFNGSTGTLNPDQVVNNPDSTAPVVTVTFSAPDGQNNWFVHSPVTGTVAADDTTTGGSNVTAIACTGATVGTITGLNTKTASAQLTVSAEGISNVSCTATDGAGNTGAGPGSSATATVKIDTGKPTLTAARVTAANTYGWNNTDVTLEFTCTDGTSGVASMAATGAATGTSSASPLDVSVTTEGLNQTVNGSCVDAAGNSADAASISGINIDKTKPVINGDRMPAANSYGWNNTDVTVTFSCAETGSVQSGINVNSVAGATVSTEGANQSVTNTGACTDKAGNSADAVAVSGINIDKTKPTITASITPAAATTGWYNISTGAPTVKFTCDDALSQIASCPADILVGEGANQTISGSATDKAGNSASTSITGINVDLTAPTISISTPANNASYVLNQTVMASYSCSDTGSSGVATCSGTAANGASLNTASVGTKTFSVTATDVAGNSATQSVSYGVIYQAGGLCYGDYGHVILQPISYTGSSVFPKKQGRTVPAKFRVCDALGNSIGTAGVVSQFQIVQIVAATGTQTVTDPVESTTPDSAFRWDASAQQWIFNISTDGLSSGSTYYFTIWLNDGSTINFNFGLR